MVKPVTPQEARSSRVQVDKRSYLKDVVMRTINRLLKRGRRLIKIPNHIEPDLVKEISEVYEAEGWTVVAKDHRHTMVGDVAWQFEFK